MAGPFLLTFKRMNMVDMPYHAKRACPFFGSIWAAWSQSPPKGDLLDENYRKTILAILAVS
jgi:hypothetical protein